MSRPENLYPRLDKIPKQLGNMTAEFLPIEIRDRLELIGRKAMDDPKGYGLVLPLLMKFMLSTASVIHLESELPELELRFGEIARIGFANLITNARNFAEVAEAEYISGMTQFPDSLNESVEDDLNSVILRIHSDVTPPGNLYKDIKPEDYAVVDASYWARIKFEKGKKYG